MLFIVPEDALIIKEFVSLKYFLLIITASEFKAVATRIIEPIFLWSEILFSITIVLNLLSWLDRYSLSVIFFSFSRIVQIPWVLNLCIFILSILDFSFISIGIFFGIFFIKSPYLSLVIKILIIFLLLLIVSIKEFNPKAKYVLFFM